MEKGKKGVGPQASLSRGGKKKSKGRSHLQPGRGVKTLKRTDLHGGGGGGEGGAETPKAPVRRQTPKS